MDNKRLAIVGAGSSGLVTLKHALEMLPGWEVRCYERGDSISGAWGHPYDGFVSTSTKYTTQFSCFPEYDASVEEGGSPSRSEFFRDGEYGEYLNRFADRFGLRDFVSFRTGVDALRTRSNGGWLVRVTDLATGVAEEEWYDAVAVCTGLVANPRSIGDDRRVVDLRGAPAYERLRGISGSRVVVIGGGEMAADFANGLSHASLGNEVYLSLRSGVRVSPRYHPIRGVPSDFLRNRLMLSIHQDMRNRIGGWFVAARMRYEELFERLYPHASGERGSLADEALHIRKEWARKLTLRSKGALFDVFHNKSDDFLTAIAEGRLRVVGPPVGDSLDEYREFDNEGTVLVEPDHVVPAVGFRSRLAELTGGAAQLEDFYLGCRHTERDDLFLVGFARPVIGNIPSISEMQARYVCSVLAGRVGRPADLSHRHAVEQRARNERFRGVDTEHIYPVEMFPYCDRLAREAGIAVRSCWSLRDWWRVWTAPATTLDYDCFAETRTALPGPPTYLPVSLIAPLMALKPFDWAYRVLRG